MKKLGNTPEKIKFINKNTSENKADFETIFKNASPDAIDFMKKILVYDPEERLTVDQALKHPFLEELHCAEDEPVMEKPLTSFHFDFEFYKLSRPQYKGKSIKLYSSA